MLTAKCIPQVGEAFDIDYAINIHYSQALQQLGTFEIRLVSSATERAKYDHNDRIEIYIDSVCVFAGLIEEIVYNDREIVLSGRNTATKLLWKITDAAKEYLNQYPDVVVHDLLSGTGISAIYGNWITPTSVYDYCGQETGYEATRSIDKNTGTYWRHNYSECHWIEYDLGASKHIIQIRIFQSDTDYERWGYSKGIKIWISDDPNSWGAVVWEGVLNNSGWVESGNFSKTGRYIRIESKSNLTVQRLYEFQACERGS